MAAVALESVTVDAADGARLLTEVSFEVAQGELVVIVGPSGSGKSSTIRAVAGLERVVSGAVRFDGVDMTHVEVRDRDVGIVFQEHALFPTHTAKRNVGFPLRIRKYGKAEIDKRVMAEARAIGIAHVLERWPRELSVGHQQLVQIARALVRVPNVLLLDEPMAHLDPPLRRRLRLDIMELQRGYGVTTIHATNDPGEAMAMADRIVAIERGRVQQIGTPAELYAAPADTHIAWLTGSISFFPARVERDTTGFWLTGEAGVRIRAWAPELGRHVGEEVSVGLRPDAVRPRPGGPVEVTIEGQTFESGAPATRVRLADVTLIVESIDEPIGTTLDVSLERCLVYGGDGRLITAVG